MSTEPLSGGVPSAHVGDDPGASELSTETENFPAAENDDPATSGQSSAVTADGGGEPVAFCAHCDHLFAAGDSLAHDCGPVEPVADTEAVETGEQNWHDELAGRLWVALDALANGGTRQVAIGQLLKARDLLAVRSRHVASSSTREDGETDGLVLPPNPFGTSATWADYNWRGIAEALRRRLDGQSAASVAIDLIADAVERSS